MSHPQHTIQVFNEHVFVIGDLHLGDGTRSDLFSLGDSVRKRDQMRSLIKTVRDNDGILIVNGDLMDLQQGWSIDRVITANAILFRELSDLGKDGKLIYVWSELDEDLSYYEELLNARTATNVLILDREPENAEPEVPESKDEESEDEESNLEDTNEESEDASDAPETSEQIAETVWAEVVQGFRFSPSIDVEKVSLRGKKLHHLIERLLGTWIRFPLENFPTIENKVVFWLLHKINWLGNKLNHAGLQKLVERAHANQIGNPNQLWSELQRQLKSGEFTRRSELLIMGHSHLPGNVSMESYTTTLINTGSWIFDSQTVLHLETASKKATLLDWQSKDEITTAPYAHLTSTHPTDIATVNSTFSDWWKRHYLGWFKFTFEYPLPTSHPYPGEEK